MRFFREHKFAGFLILVILIAAGFLVWAAATGGSGNGAGGTVFGKISQPFSAAGRKLSGAGAGIFSYRETNAENQKLKQENQELKQKLRQAELSQSELDQLQDLKKALKYQEKGDQGGLVTCSVTASDGTDWMSVFTLNAGKEAGIRKGDPVVTGEGLVGRIRSVGRGWSKVETIYDTSANLSFRVSRSHKIFGILDSSDGNIIRGWTLDNSAKIKKGDVLETSGLGTYPGGIEIGTVTKVKYVASTQLMTVEVQPAFQVSEIEKAAVLL